MSPNHPKTQHRSIRISDEDWTDLADAAAAEDSDRAKVVNQLIQWYLRRPGVKQPKRPTPSQPRHEAG
jgi:hypothetical protein